MDYANYADSIRVICAIRGYFWIPRAPGILIRLSKLVSFIGAQIASVSPENKPFQPKYSVSSGFIRVNVLGGSIQGAVKFLGSLMTSRPSMWSWSIIL